MAISGTFVILAGGTAVLSIVFGIRLAMRGGGRRRRGGAAIGWRGGVGGGWSGRA